MEKRETVFNALHLHFNNRLYDNFGGNDGLLTLARVLVKKKKCVPDAVTTVSPIILLI